MNTNEKKLFFELCKFENINNEEIKRLIEEGAASAELLGHLHINRVAAVAYDVLKQSGNIDSVNREFRNSLKDAYTVNIEKNDSFYECLDIVSKALKECDTSKENKYALLKGAYLCGKYPLAYRTSNDIDILVHSSNVTEIGNALKNSGFIQGFIRNGKIVPASRSDIITSKMMRGETVPFIKEVGLPSKQFLEVDINFSLDYKNDDSDIVEHMISHAENKYAGYSDILTLDKYDFIIHLCVHLFKEATTLPWVKMKRDMTMYKYLDIYYLINNFSDTDALILVSRIKDYQIYDPCYFAIASAKKLFNMESKVLNFILSSMMPSDDIVLDHVIDPENNRVLTYTEKDLSERLFSNDRVSLLEV